MKRQMFPLRTIRGTLVFVVTFPPPLSPSMPSCPSLWGYLEEEERRRRRLLLHKVAPAGRRLLPRRRMMIMREGCVSLQSAERRPWRIRCSTLCERVQNLEEPFQFWSPDDRLFRFLLCNQNNQAHNSYSQRVEFTQPFIELFVWGGSST